MDEKETIKNGWVSNADRDSKSQGMKRFGVPLLDDLLRRREGFFEEIFEAKDLVQYFRWLFWAIITLGAIYGVAMGSLGWGSGLGRGIAQMVSSAAKVPLLYLASLLVCFPVLYIVLVLLNVRLSFLQTLLLILMALALNAVLLASCAPVVLFFVLTGSSYEFIKLLHVMIFGFSGAWAMMALWQGLRTMCEKSDLYPRQAIKILQVWILIFGFVGTQMAWTLRPFIGSPDQAFQWFRRDQTGNFYQAVGQAIIDLTRQGITSPGSSQTIDPEATNVVLPGATNQAK